ncbi:MAG: NADH-quinone oxidoreductase subunit NuoK [Anaerolineae bacterium]|nr:NADH-quinone oxidoreductase subunit NuoK [Anaerolineae bacterium]
MAPLSWYLALAAGLFCVGLYAVLGRRNAVTILMGVVLMLNGVLLNMVALWRYVASGTADGQVFALLVILITAAEVLVGLALAVALWRERGTAVVDELESLRE